jgi:hypothetical protein
LLYPTSTNFGWHHSGLDLVSRTRRSSIPLSTDRHTAKDNRIDEELGGILRAERGAAVSWGVIYSLLNANGQRQPAYEPPANNHIVTPAATPPEQAPNDLVPASVDVLVFRQIIGENPRPDLSSNPFEMSPTTAQSPDQPRTNPTTRHSARPGVHSNRNV